MKEFPKFNNFLNEGNNNFFKKQIIDAYLWIRKNNNTIPDEVLDFMKEAALEKLEKDDSPKSPRKAISEKDKKEFIDYCAVFYTKGGVWSEFFNNNLTKKDITYHMNDFLKNRENFEGDSFDREAFRDYLLDKINHVEKWFYNISHLKK